MQRCLFYIFFEILMNESYLGYWVSHICGTTLPFSVVKTLSGTPFPACVMMAYPIYHPKGEVSSWRRMGFFLFFQRKEQTASAAVFSPTLLLGKQAGTFRIGDGTLHRLSGKLQITGNGSDSRIALILLITPIFQVHIHILGAMRQITVIDCRKISPDIPP